MAIRNLNQLQNAIRNGTIPKIMQVASEIVVKTMKEELKKAEISTASLRECITYKIEGNKSTIYIDYDLVQSTYASEGEIITRKNGSTKIVWGWFTNTFDGSGGFRNEDTWNGLPISFNLAKWIEEGQGGRGKLLGNQPIKATHWFTNTIDRLKKELPHQIKIEMAKK